MNSKIFRSVALERLSSPERLDQAWRVTGPKEWLALLGIFFLLSVAGVWGFVGSLATKVTAEGVIIRRGGVVNVVASGAGLVVKLNVKTGDTVRANQVIAQIAQPVLSEKIKVTEDALADAKRERERALRVRTDSARLQLDALAGQLGVVEEYRASGLAAGFYATLVRNARKLGYGDCEMSWILEDNVLMNRSLEVMGAKRYKTYRIYEWN